MKKSEIEFARDLVLLKVKNSYQLDPSGYRTSRDAQLLGMRLKAALPHGPAVTVIEGHWRHWQLFDVDRHIKVECFQLLRMDLYKFLLHQLLGLNPSSRAGHRSKPIQGSILWLTRLDAWVATAVRCLMEGKQRGGHQNKMFADMYMSKMNLAFGN